jgi:hypothetical protein
MHGEHCSLVQWDGYRYVLRCVCGYERQFTHADAATVLAKLHTDRSLV